LAKSSEAIARPYVEVGKFEDGIVRPNEGVVKASVGLVKPGEAPVKEREEIGKPNQDPVKPSQGLAKSSEAIARPYVEVGKFEDGIVRPNEGVVKVIEGFVKPGEAPVKEREEIGKAGEAIDRPSEEIGVRVFSIDGAQQLPAAGFKLSALENQAAIPERQVLDFHFISAANAVAESIAVSSASGSSNESTLRIRLKADVLDGSSIKIETNNSELKITVIPASRAAEEMLLRNCELFQAQLAERVANWRINVGVAALERRANHKSEEET
jgi:hypothetical protein